MRILDRCLQIAHCEFFKKRQQQGKFYHWSFVLNARYELVAWATNRAAIPDKERKFGYGYDRHSVHAEIIAYRRALRRYGLLRSRPWYIVNVRLKSDAAFGCSAPCQLCFHFLLANGCRRCYYTTNEQTFETLMLEMPHCLHLKSV